VSRQITEDTLEGIALALRVYAPHLLPTIHKLLKTGIVNGPSGQSADIGQGTLTNALPWDEGEPVMLALQAIERENGCNAMFAGRQINLLVLRWREFAEPRQLPPQPSAPMNELAPPGT
jgi:hypothetical protein